MNEVGGHENGGIPGNPIAADFKVSERSSRDNVAGRIEAKSFREYRARVFQGGQVLRPGHPSVENGGEFGAQ